MWSIKGWFNKGGMRANFIWVFYLPLVTIKIWVILLIIVLKWKKVRILKKSLNITFINPNTEEQIVQAMASCLAYNLAENYEKIKFDYKNLTYYSN